MNNAVGNIVVFGGGLAAHLTALALAQHLPNEVTVTFVQSKADAADDLSYGTVTSPSTYAFLLNLNISEPEILLETDTSFSLGTRFESWGEENREWTQTFHHPMPIHHGVKFHHYVNRHNQRVSDWSIDPYLMSVHAAEKGVFAHPPEGKNIPLATIEYGYHFAVETWVEFISKRLKTSRAKVIQAEQLSLIHEGEDVKSAKLDTGEIIAGDLFIDCRAQDEGTFFKLSRAIMGASIDEFSNQLDDVVRTLTQTAYGWHAVTPLRGRRRSVFIYDEDDKEMFSRAHPEANNNAAILIGHLDAPWQNNVVIIGQRAGALEPLSPAPLMLLQNDLERLLELIPTEPDMTIEACEYNRRFVQDFDNAANFHRALFTDTPKVGSAYLRNACSSSQPPELSAKLSQFQNRGVHVSYDNELFSEQDWVLLHLGMGRTPARYDPLTDRASEAQISQMLGNMERANKQMAMKMPPHELYMTNLLKFLKDKHV